MGGLAAAQLKFGLLVPDASPAERFRLAPMGLREFKDGYDHPP